MHTANAALELVLNSIRMFLICFVRASSHLMFPKEVEILFLISLSFSFFFFNLINYIVVIRILSCLLQYLLLSRLWPTIGE